MPAITDYNGPDVPLGFIKVTAAGTPVQMTSEIDATGTMSPETSNKAGGPLYPPLRFQQLIIQGMKPAAHGMQDNTGNIYICREGGTRDTPELIVAVIKSGQTFFMSSAPKVNDTWNPYRYWIDADNNDDGALITGIKQG